jgi:hypothetical protein
LWNAITLPRVLLEQGWSDGALTPEDTQDALAVFRHVTVGASLPDHLVTRVGPPIVMADDPRIRYQDQEAALLATLRREAARHAAKV